MKTLEKQLFIGELIEKRYRRRQEILRQGWPGLRSWIHRFRDTVLCRAIGIDDDDDAYFLGVKSGHNRVMERDYMWYFL